MATKPTTNWEQELEELTRSAALAADSMLLANPSDTAISEQSLLLWSLVFELFSHPSEESLAAFHSLSRHSWILEQSRARLILTAMREGAATRATWLELIKAKLPRPVSAAEASQHQRSMSTWGDAFQPNRSHASVDDVMAPMTVLLQEDSASLFEYLESLGDWELVEHALLLSGAVSTFAEWQGALSRSAVAFDAAGKWEKSFVVLLLLKRAQDDLLLEPGEQLFGKSQSETAWDVEAVIAEVRKRVDWMALLRCWSVVVFRNYIAFKDSASSQNTPKAARKQARLMQILGFMPDEVRHTRPSGPPPSGYPAWYAWYERGLECLWHLPSGGNAVPTAQVLDLYRQAITWETNVSKEVRHRRAQIDYGRQELFVGALDLHLGATLADSAHTVTAWAALWRQTLPLREAVEFGTTDSDDQDAWLDRSASSSLTELVIRLGIAAAHTIAQSPSEAPEQDGLKIASLLGLMQESVIEMASIEVLRADVWTQAIRYMLLLWGRLRSAPAGYALLPRTEQAVHERSLIQYVSTDPAELLRALTASANNGIPDAVLTTQLSSASLDFATSLAHAKRLSQIGRPGRELPPATLALGDRLAAALAAI